jgi:hypothetical protein
MNRQVERYLRFGATVDAAVDAGKQAGGNRIELLEHAQP